MWILTAAPAKSYARPRNFGIWFPYSNWLDIVEFGLDLLHSFSGALHPFVLLNSHSFHEILRPIALLNAVHKWLPSSFSVLISSIRSKCLVQTLDSFVDKPCYDIIPLGINV